MRIIFMGTPEFAVPSLRRLVMSSHQILAVVTQPDRPKGRGLRVASPPVKGEALQHGIPILQPENLKDQAFLAKLKQLNGECFAVVGFRILPPEIYEMPPKGTVNLHASLLPKYRGAAPIQWALINGEKRTGVTTFFITKNVDAGDLILQEEVDIKEQETAGELHDRLAVIGAELLLRSLDLIELGKVKSIPQKGEPTPAPKILPKHCRINWKQPAERIVNLIRGLSPSPGAFTFWDSKRIKIFKASVEKTHLEGTFRPGEVVQVSEKGIVVGASKGMIRIQELQMEGRRRMKVDEFLRGNVLYPGVVFGEV
ncbi:MAG: methionyl-tRNA formyltransferase [Candidatus Neomarinimicrobiota bacterium]|nr:MAG: methionyl-tRNA formyltransferase [Candidatus Neomarinimicrobiota bacterium]